MFFLQKIEDDDQFPERRGGRTAACEIERGVTMQRDKDSTCSSSISFMHSSDEYSASEIVAPETPVARSSISRTLAIVKNHGLNHRFDIEGTIQEHGFEIVKERQMEFDCETDPDTLYELFGEDASSLAEGPVWVYVLERRHAVETWLDLMGDADPIVAREHSPSSLRALYGLSLSQNAIMGSPDDQLAEIQIMSLFASSPPFPSTDLPDTASSRFNSLRSVSSSVLSALRKGSEDEGYAKSDPSTLGNGSKGSGSGGHTPRLGTNGKPLFRARPIPNTHLVPSIQPRTTRSAALRASVGNVPRPSFATNNTSPRSPPTAERLAQTFANVPGHKFRSAPIPVASTAPPALAPRMTRAASLRLGQKVPETPRKRTLTDPNENAFEGVPGHKRRESISVASTAPPSVAPRTNKSAHLRSVGGPPPSSFMFKQPVAPKLPGRSLSQIGMNAVGELNGARPSSAQSISRSNSTSNAISTPNPKIKASVTYGRRQSALPSSTHRAPSRTDSSSNGNVVQKAMSLSPPTSSSTLAGEPPGPKIAQRTAPAAMVKPRASSVQAPTIAPRTNRSALLRAAKMEAEEKAKETQKAGRKSGVPSARAIFA